MWKISHQGCAVSVDKMWFSEVVYHLPGFSGIVAILGPAQEIIKYSTLLDKKQSARISMLEFAEISEKFESNARLRCHQDSD